jgi:hypothetical protein
MYSSVVLKCVKNVGEGFDSAVTKAKKRTTQHEIRILEPTVLMFTVITDISSCSICENAICIDISLRPI